MTKHLGQDMANHRPIDFHFRSTKSQNFCRSKAGFSRHVRVRKRSNKVIISESPLMKLSSLSTLSENIHKILGNFIIIGFNPVSGNLTK